MHFGSFTYVGESVTDPAKYYRNNVINTVNLLDEMREFDVKYFIFSSTCAIYGMPKQIPITEDHPQMPINPYGWSKLMMEPMGLNISICDILTPPVQILMPMLVSITNPKHI